VESTIGFEAFKPKETIPKYTVEKNPLSEFLSKVGLKLNCPNGTRCPGYQSCCRAGRGYRCCPYAFVRISILNSDFYNFLKTLENIQNFNYILFYL